ncbi:hypothetical protein EZV62_006981 [Acer yangbiense]|uniref:AAA+ ATPase domain-containing protein n=1 Tax=Acer yangbiense TaxID=1000413 RepID=A0A5C7IBC4_9ROSI|nr:hypothetical protein EZV62_006981 [Acer yangbiense]
MVEIALSVAAKVAECLVAPIAQPFSYIWNYKTNLDNLKTEARKLEVKRDAVLHSIEVARGNGNQIEQHVSDWLDRVKTVTDEVSEVLEENERANMKCFKGLCPNPKKRYQHSRNAVKKAKAVARLYEAGSFQTVSFSTIPKEIWIPSHKGYETFESRMSTLRKILDALSNPDVNTVGIYGAGGIGKTTLVRAIAEHAEGKKLFEVVAFAKVAVNPDIKEIQQEIADKLGLKFPEESVSGRARRLQERLQQEKVLLVLDNIWARLNLEEVGIPFGKDHKGCKLLLTARSLDVLSEMDSQCNFQIGVLDKGEAWSLFKKRAGACIESSDCLQALARKVADACGGFPIALNSVAVALKNKEESEWKDALDKLTTPSKSNFEGVTEETYSSIEISYSQLKEKQLKSTFLLCCIMEYTDLDALLEYGMGLGIFEDVNTMEKARNRVNTLVRKLKDSSLLLDINNSRFSLHDVVRYVGRSIASREGHMFTVANNDIPREWVDKDILKNCVGISLYNINKLPEEFECPELQFFYLRTTSGVPDNFFAGMPKLKVLHLAGLELYSVPTSIRLLVNLQTLYIDNCKLRDIDFIGEFKQLEILRIRGSYGSKIEIEMIPKKMCNLTGLRLLDLKDCSILRKIPPNVLSNFTRLEELYLPGTDPFRNCIIEWEVEGVNILDELKHLMDLTALKISIPHESVLPKGRLVSNKLERYNIIIGNCNWYVFYGQTSSRIVKLNLETSSCSDDVQKFFSLLDREGFLELEYLHVENSPCFRTVVDCLESESCHHFLFLQSLSLYSVLNLEMIHNYPLKADSFRQLRTITVEKCNKLKNILSFSTYRALPLLQEVNVSSCDNMEEIFAINRREEDINNDEGTDQIEFKHLSSLTLTSLPKLKSFCSDTPTLLFNQKVAFPSLEELKISEMIDLEMIWPNQLCNDSFCNLKSLEVRKCNKLLTVFQSNMVERVTRLEYLTIRDCDLVEEIFDLQGVDYEESHPAKETLLRKLDFKGLPKLKHIWNKDPQKMFTYQKLSSVYVYDCMSLKYLFPVSIAESLLELKQLCVHHCGVEEIVAGDQGEAKVAATFVFPRITSLDLNNLPQLKTFYRGVHTSQWQNLKSLAMHYCDKVELFASELFDFQENNESQHGSSVQPLFIVEKVTFPSLEEIKISKSNNLKILWQKEAKESLCNLKSVKVSDCKELLTIFQFNTLEGLSMPKSLTVTISNCASVKVIFDLQKVNFEESHSRAVTYRLQKLYINGLPKLKHIWKKDPQEELSFEELPMPKSLTVSNCASVKEIFDLQKVNFEESHSRPVTYQLQKLYISGLPKLKHIWKKDPQEELSFENLQRVYVSDCQSLKDLFPASIGRSLLQLVELNVINCGKLEEIVAKEGEAKEAARFVFPKVTSIRLEGLPELRTFYRGVHSSKWEVLKELKVVGCDKIELLASQLSCFQENNIGESYIDISVQPPFFLVEKDSFPILEKLILIGEGARMISQGQFSEELFCNLKFLQVYKDKSVVLFPLRILQRFQHLHELHLKSSSYKEIFSYEEDETHVRVDSKPDMVLSKLEKLTVGDCQNLIQLVPSSTSFQNLTVLKVCSCDGLKNLMTSSTAKRLVQLREMAIGYCKSMIEVVAKGGDVTEDKIIFSKLRTLTLGYLPSLSCFCPENYTFELPSLEDIIVYRCPEMKYFSLGDITTRILQKVRRDSMNYTLEGGLNTTIQKTHDSRVDDFRDQQTELYLQLYYQVPPFQMLNRSDSSSAVSWVNGDEGVGHIRFLDIILEIREILSGLKPKVSVRYVNRSNNVAADFLAKQGALNGLDQMGWAA